MTTALILTGEGYGNIIMTTPLIRAVVTLGYDVHALVEDNWGDGYKLLRGMPGVTVYGAREAVESATWDVVIPTLWNRNTARIRNKRIVCYETASLLENHEAAVNLTAAEALGYCGPMPEPYCYGGLSQDILEPGYTVLCPGWGGKDPGWARKAWPHWAALAGELGGRAIVLDSAGKDHEWAREGHYGEPLEDVVLPLLAHAECVISIDNGLAHMAAAMGTKTVVLFGPTNETKNRPLGRDVRIVKTDMECRPCQMTEAWGTCPDTRCMLDITVGMVMEAMN